MSERISAALLVVGALFMLLAGLGLLRLPDLFTRLQAATKASTLGVGYMLLAAAIHFQDLAVTTRAVLIVAFFFLTAPVGAHMIARAAYAVWASPCGKGRSRTNYVTSDALQRIRHQTGPRTCRGLRRVRKATPADTARR